MSRWDRRTTLRMAFHAGAMSAATLLVPARLHAADKLIQPPSGRMRYSRLLITEMMDGARFSVKRYYEVMFSRFSDGFLIEGHEVDVLVEAPARLDRFAQIERQRKEQGLFPMVLDPFGMLLPDLDAGADSSAVDEAVSIADEMIEKSEIPEGDRAQLSGLVASIDQATIAFTAHLPTDLFCPPRIARVREDAVQLADGSTGQVTTRFGGVRDRSSALMQSAARDVTTQIGDDRRAVREEWELRAL